MGSLPGSADKSTDEVVCKENNSLYFELWLETVGFHFSDFSVVVWLC